MEGGGGGGGGGELSGLLFEARDALLGTESTGVMQLMI